MSKIVFDIGGTNLRIAIADNTKVHSVETTPTPQEPQEALVTLIKTIERLTNAKPLTALVGGVAGIIDTSGTIITSPHLPLWKDFPLAKLLSDHFSIPVILRNDSEMAGLGEACFGAGVDYTTVAYLGVGTGVGGTRIVGKAPVSHAYNFEPGHQILDTVSGDTLESLISGSSLTKRHNIPPYDLPRDTWKELSKIFAVGIMNTIVYWTPNVVVLGGSLMNEDNGFRIKDIENALKNLHSPYPELPPLHHAHLKDQSGLYGALAIIEN